MHSTKLMSTHVKLFCTCKSPQAGNHVYCLECWRPEICLLVTAPALLALCVLIHTRWGTMGVFLSSQGHTCSTVAILCMWYQILLHKAHSFHHRVRTYLCNPNLQVYTSGSFSRSGEALMISLLNFCNWFPLKALTGNIFLLKSFWSNVPNIQIDFKKQLKMIEGNPQDNHCWLDGLQTPQPRRAIQQHSLIDKAPRIIITGLHFRSWKWSPDLWVRTTRLLVPKFGDRECHQQVGRVSWKFFPDAAVHSCDLCVNLHILIHFSRQASFGEIHVAAYKNNIQIMKFLLQRGVNIDQLGLVSLHVCAFAQKLVCFWFLC